MTEPARRAQVLLDVGRHDAALEILMRHLATNPADPYALCLAAQAQLAAHAPREALESARVAAGLRPDDDWPLRLSAIASMRLRRFRDARSAAEAALRVSPTEWQCHVTRAEVDLAKGRVSRRTWANARRALELAPDEPAAHRTLARVATRANRLRLAERALRDALRLNPDDAASQTDLAALQMRRNRVGRAMAGFVNAARLDPTSKETAGYLEAALFGPLTFMTCCVVLPPFGYYLISTWGQSGSARTQERQASLDHAARVWLPVALVVAIGIAVAYLWWVARTAGPAFVVVVRAALRRGVAYRLWIACLGVGLVLDAVAAAIGRRGSHLLGVAAVLAGWALIAAVVMLSWRRWRRRDR